MAFTLTQKTAFRRTIDRHWAPYLSSAEARVVSFLFTSTIEWGKDTDRFKSEHFTYGIGNAAGTGLSDKTVRRALDTLAMDGAISRSRTQYGQRIKLNMDWEPGDLRVPKHNKKTQIGGLAAPRKARQIGQNDLSRSVKMTDPYTKEHTFKDNTLDSPSAIASDARTAPVRFTTVRDAIAVADAKRAKDRAKAAAKVDPLSILRRWTEAFRDTFPEASVPAWTKREQGQAKLFIRTAGANEGVVGIDVLDWGVRSWKLILGARFAWMKDAPELPTIGFMLRFKDRFYDAWNERERLRGELAMTGGERKLRRLMGRGLTHEEATKEVNTRDALAEERIKIAEERKELHQQMRRAEERVNQRDPSRFLREPKRVTKAGPLRPTLGDGDDF